MRKLRNRVARAWGAYNRYYDLGMQHIAGSATYFGVLTLFPLIGLLFATAGWAVQHDPELQSRLDEALEDGLGVPVDTGASYFSAEAAASARAVLATMGITGILYAGRLWVDASRRALQVVWPAEPGKPPFILWRYARDYLVLLVFIAATILLLSAALAATGGPYKVLAWHGHALNGWAVALLRVCAAIVTFLWGALMYHLLYRRMGGAPANGALRQSSLLGGACLAGLAISGLLLLRHAFADPFFGVVVATLGLLLWVSAAVRSILALAVWAKSETAETAPTPS